MMRSVSWNQFPIKKFADWFDLVSFVETSYLQNSRSLSCVFFFILILINVQLISMPLYVLLLLFHGLSHKNELINKPTQL